MYCREKLPQYDIDLSFMFPINQTGCVVDAVENKKNTFTAMLKYMVKSNERFNDLTTSASNNLLKVILKN